MPIATQERGSDWKLSLTVSPRWAFLIQVILQVLSLQSRISCSPNSQNGAISDGAHVSSSGQHSIDIPDQWDLDVGSTKANNATVSFINLNMNANANPCEDFYKFACTNNRISPSDEVEMLNSKRLERMLRDRRLFPTRSINMQRLRKFWASCERTSNRRKSFMSLMDGMCPRMGLGRVVNQPIMSLLRQLAGQTWFPLLASEHQMEAEGRQFDWVQASISGAELGLGYEYFFKIHSYLDPVDNRFRFRVNQLKAGRATRLRSREQQVDYYLNMVDYLMPLSTRSARHQLRREQIGEVVELRARMYLHRGDHKLTDEHEFQLKSLAQLQSEAPSVDWARLLSGLLGRPLDGSSERVSVHVGRFLADLDSLLAHTPPRVLANHVMLSQLELMGPLVASRLYKLVDHAQPDCVQMLQMTMGTALSAEFVRFFGRPVARQRATRLVDSLRSELLSLLDELTWMSEPVRQRAKLAAQGLQVFVGYPDKLLDDSYIESIYGSLQFSETSFLENFRLARRTKLRHDFSLISRESPETKGEAFLEKWISKSWLVQANNMVNGGMITISSGMLDGFIYDERRSELFNLAVFGFVVAHELAHSFDQLGAQFYRSELHHWWDEQTRRSYELRASCFRSQYGAQLIPGTGTRIDGERTLIENLADNLGYRLAYRAFSRWLEASGPRDRDTASVGGELGERQLFWLSAANFWCGQQLSAAQAEALYSRGDHAPDEVRVNVPLSNLDEFAHDFNCPLGAAMNPQVKCLI